MQSLQKKRRVLMKTIWKMVPGLAMALCHCGRGQGTGVSRGAGWPAFDRRVRHCAVHRHGHQPLLQAKRGHVARYPLHVQKGTEARHHPARREPNIMTVLKVGRFSLTVMLFTLATCFGVGYFIGKALGLNWKMSNLISAGTGICGGSAIAAIAPSLTRRMSTWPTVCPRRSCSTWR